MEFNRSYPKLASFLKDHFAISRKSQQQSLWHWFTLILFGTFILATFTQQLLLLFSLILLVALIKGPGMILLGSHLCFFNQPFSSSRYHFICAFLSIESQYFHQKLASHFSCWFLLFLPCNDHVVKNALTSR